MKKLKQLYQMLPDEYKNRLISTVLQQLMRTEHTSVV